jgi:hypothetical protein
VKVFTQTHQGRHPAPWGRLAVGDSVWMKWSGGPVIAKSIVNGFRQIEDCTPDVLRTAAAGSLLATGEDYFGSLPPFFDAVVIYLQDERWLDTPFVPRLRSRGESWIVLDTDDLRSGWLTADPKADVGLHTHRGPSPGRGEGTRTLSYALRFAVLRRDGFTCTYCGRCPPEVRLHVDHIVPWSKGGSNRLENLRAACDACNLGKGTRSATLPGREHR